MIAPKIPLVQDGQILSTNLVNSMIGRIEYAADLLRQYKLVAGDEMYVEPHFDGTRVSYNQPVGGGATPVQPIVVALPPFFNPNGAQNARANTIWVMDNMTLEDNPRFINQILDMFNKGILLDGNVFTERYPGQVMLIFMKSNGLMAGPSTFSGGFLSGTTFPKQPFDPFGVGVIGGQVFCKLIGAPTLAAGPIGIWISGG